MVGVRSTNVQVCACALLMCLCIFSCSYGLYWGISGYMMLARNRGNMCGVATEAGLPIP